MDFVLTGGEAHGTGDAVGGVLVEEQLHDEAAFHVAVVAEGFLGSFSNDALVGLTVDHDLPAAGTDGLGTGTHGLASGKSFSAVEVVDAIVSLGPDREAPILEELDGVVNVTAYVEDEVIANDVHKVVADHAHVVVRSVVFKEGVDGGKALGHSAGTLEGGLIAEEHFDAEGFGPADSFDSGAGGAHAAAHDQQVGLMFFISRFGNTNAARRFLNRDHRHSSLLLNILVTDLSILRKTNFKA